MKTALLRVQSSSSQVNLKPLGFHRRENPPQALRFTCDSSRLQMLRCFATDPRTEVYFDPFSLFRMASPAGPAVTSLGGPDDSDLASSTSRMARNTSRARGKKSSIVSPPRSAPSKTGLSARAYVRCLPYVGSFQASPLARSLATLYCSLGHRLHTIPEPSHRRSLRREVSPSSRAYDPRQTAARRSSA